MCKRNPKKRSNIEGFSDPSFFRINYNPYNEVTNLKGDVNNEKSY